MRLRLVLFTAVLAGSSTSAFAQQPCERLLGIAVPGLQIVSAMRVSAGPFQLPNAPPDATPQVLPAFCRVAAVVTPEVRFELWMPANGTKASCGWETADWRVPSPSAPWLSHCSAGTPSAAPTPGILAQTRPTEHGRSDITNGLWTSQIVPFT